MASKSRSLGVPLLAAWCLFGLISGTGVQFRYAIIDLGTFGGNTSVAWAVNNSGIVVGGADAPDGWRHAFRWANGQLDDLGNMGFQSHYEATDISSNGLIVGYTTTTGDLSGAFIWQNGQMSAIPTSHPKNALGVNDDCQVVGQATFPPPGGGTRAYLYQNGMMTDLGTLGGNISIAWDINMAGQVTGRAQLADNSYHAFLWENGIKTDLGTLGGTYSVGMGINDFGNIAGSSTWTSQISFNRAFHWDGKAMVDLDGGHFSSSDAWGINNHGQVVGNPDYLYDPVHGLIDLENCLPANSGWTDLNPRDINDDGQIVGTGTNPQGMRRAFLMNPMPPIPAASSWTIAAVALGLMLAGATLLRRRRRAAGA